MKCNKKNWLKAPLLIISFCLVIFACRKELQPPSKNEVLENPTVKMDVELAKAFYRNFKKENGDKVNMTQYANLSQSNKKTSALRTESDGITNRKYLFFKKAYTSETPNSSFVEVPVLYNQRFSTILPNVKLSSLEKKEIFAASFDRMIIFKNKKTGKSSQRMITFIPNIEYLRKHKNDISHNHITRLDKDFDGYLEYKDWSGNPLYIIKYVKGKKTKIIRLKNKAKIRNANLNMATARTTCTVHLVEIWGESCVVVDPEGFYQQCEPYLVDSYFVEECVEEDDPLTGDPCIDYGDCLTGDPCLDYGDCLTGDPCIDFGICGDAGSEAQAQLYQLETATDSYRNRMSSLELAIYNTMNIMEKIAYLSNAHSAESIAQMRFPTSLYNGIGDAFRHAYFHGLNASTIGTDLSLRLGNAHEASTPTSLGLEREMDLFNNAVGRTVGPNQTVLDWVLEELEYGSLRYLAPLNPDGTIIPGVTVIKHTNQ